MKKMILLAIVAMVSVVAYARKSYITVTTSPYAGAMSNYIQLTGDVPDGIADFQYSNRHYWYFDGEFCNVGEILNILSGYGFEVESMIPVNDSSAIRVHYLLSKEVPSTQPSSTGDINKDGRVNVTDVTELVNIILGIVKQNPGLLEQAK